MDHVAIMKKSWGLTQKILSGKKRIESRWYQFRCAPWDKIGTGDSIYFKDAGEPVTLQAKVANVLQFSGLTPEKVKELLNRYGAEDGIEKHQIPEYYQKFKNKKYCLLIFLRDPKKIRPFEIDKTGFGMMAAWITIDRVKRIKKERPFP